MAKGAYVPLDVNYLRELNARAEEIVRGEEATTDG